MISLLENGLKYLGLTHPPTGRMIAENGDAVNIAEFLRSLPMSIARGEMPGAAPFGATGERTVTGSEANAPVWANGPILKLPDAGVQMTLSSDAQQDAAEGSNIRSIELHYLDRDLDPRLEIIVLDGTNGVLTQATDIRWIQDVHLHTFGTVAFAAGNIKAIFDGDVYAQMSPGSVDDFSAFRMVPRGKVLYLAGAVGSSVSATADTRTLLSLVASESGNNLFHDPLILVPFTRVGLQNGPVGFRLPIPRKFSAGTLVGGIHTTNKAGVVTLSWFGHIENATEDYDGG